MCYYMSMQKDTNSEKVRVNIRIPKDVHMKAKMLAASMDITVSHLIEGLIMGAQLIPGNVEAKP